MQGLGNSRVYDLVSEDEDSDFWCRKIQGSGGSMWVHTHWGDVRASLGLYRVNGKEHESYYLGFRA